MSTVDIDAIRAALAAAKSQPRSISEKGGRHLIDTPSYEAARLMFESPPWLKALVEEVERLRFDLAHLEGHTCEGEAEYLREKMSRETKSLGALWAKSKADVERLQIDCDRLGAVSMALTERALAAEARAVELLERLDGWKTRSEEQGAATERAAVVDWLRAQVDDCPAFESAADDIARGDHLKAGE